MHSLPRWISASVSKSFHSNQSNEVQYKIKKMSSDDSLYPFVHVFN